MGKIIHEVVFDIPRQHYGSYRNLHELVILKQELFYDYRTGPPSYERLYQDTIRWIEDYPYERLKRGVEACNGPVMLEFCLRYGLSLSADRCQCAVITDNRTEQALR